MLDLRRNTGGFLDQALAAHELLRPARQGARDRARVASARRSATSPRRDPIAPTIPMVILTDGYSASASEIVAGALQDHDRALIVGTTSFGKGLVQSVYQLDGGYAIKLTTGKWYTPSGRSIQKERQLDGNGNYVEVTPDSLETDASRLSRPQFKSDGGRIVYGGGAITPDVIVPYDTLSSAEQKLAARTRAASRRTSTSCSTTTPSASRARSSPTSRSSRRCATSSSSASRPRASPSSRADWTAGTRYVDRLLSDRVARRAFGDSTWKRRDVPEDPQLHAGDRAAPEGPHHRRAPRARAGPGDAGRATGLVFGSVRRSTIRHSHTVLPMSKRILIAAALLGAAACEPSVPPVTVAAEPGETRLSNITQLTFGGENAEAYWSADGKWITFQSSRDGRTCDQQFVMRADGSDVKRVSDGRGKTTCGWFLPGGDRLFFGSSHGARRCLPGQARPLQGLRLAARQVRHLHREPRRLRPQAAHQLRRVHGRGRALARREDDRLHVAQGRRPRHLHDERRTARTCGSSPTRPATTAAPGGPPTARGSSIARTTRRTPPSCASTGSSSRRASSVRARWSSS